MFTESEASSDVMLPRMGKFVQALSVWQTREGSNDGGLNEAGRHAVAIYSTPTVLALTFLSIFTKVPLYAIRKGVTFCAYMSRDFRIPPGTNTYVASSSRYLPIQEDSYIGHYTDHILRTDHT